MADTPQSVKSSHRTTHVVASTRLGDLQDDAPDVSPGASAIAIPSRSAPRPMAHPSQFSTDVAPQTSHLVPPRGGIAIAAPSRVVASHSSQPLSHATPNLSDTVRARDPQRPTRIRAPLNSSVKDTTTPTITSGPFDLTQIDPSLQQTMTPFPPQAVPISFEGSSRTPIDNNPTNISTGEAVAQGEGDISPVRDGSQGKPKRKRAKRPLNAESSTGGPPKKRRSPRDPNTQPGAEDEDSQTTLEPRRRGKSRAPSVPPFDPDAHPGEDLDPTTVTMASLCDDTGQGRVSSKATQVISNHATWRTTSKEKRARLRAIAEAKKYGRDIDDDDQSPAVNSGDAAEPSEANPSQKAPSTSRSPSAVPQAGPSTPSTERPAQGGRMGDEFDYSTDLSTSRYNVQVRIGANGETIIDEESLFVNRNEEDDTQNYTHVEESDTTKFVNSLTYSKKTQGSRWSTEETDLFFDVSNPPG